MEDTIDSRSGNLTGQIFRITYKNRDFQFRLLNGVPSKDAAEIDLLFDGAIQKLVKNNNRWAFKNSSDDNELANDIWRAISLRYRIFT